MPLDATLDQFEARFQALAQDRQSIDERVAEEDELIRQTETQLQALELQQDVPTEEALQSPAGAAMKVGSSSRPPGSKRSWSRRGSRRFWLISRRQTPWPQPTSERSIVATYWPTACAARPIALLAKPSELARSTDTSCPEGVR